MLLKLNVVISADPVLLGLIRTSRQSFGSRLDRIEAMLRQIIKQENETMATLADLQTEVTKQDTVIGSAVTLIQGLSAQLKAALASADPAQIQAIIDHLDANDAALAQAVADNTLAAVAVVPAPPV